MRGFAYILSLLLLSSFFVPVSHGDTLDLSDTSANNSFVKTNDCGTLCFGDLAGGIEHLSAHFGDSQGVSPSAKIMVPSMDGSSPFRYLSAKIAMSGLRSKTHVDVEIFTIDKKSFPGGKGERTLVDPKSKWGRQRDVDGHGDSYYKVISPDGKVVASVAEGGKVLKIRKNGRIVWKLN